MEITCGGLGTFKYQENFSTCYNLAFDVYVDVLMDVREIYNSQLFPNENFNYFLNYFNSIVQEIYGGC